MLCLGATFLYVGGMFLNDAFDANFDRDLRKERPIPSGAISEQEVWVLGFTWIVVGATCLFWMGKTTALFAALLVACILFYDWIHKKTILSPLPMAGCRLLLYLLAASTARNGINEIILWSASALAAYIIGLSYIAKSESAPGPIRFWPCIFLLVPILLKFSIGQPPLSKTLILFSLVLLFWILWNLRKIFLPGQKNIAAAVSGLLSVIVLVDLLAAEKVSSEILVAFVFLFVSARIFQKFIPAT